MSYHMNFPGPGIITPEMAAESPREKGYGASTSWCVCKFCGHNFRAGQWYRFILTSVPMFGNSFVCAACDAPDDELKKRAAVISEEIVRRFSWMLDDDQVVWAHWSGGKIITPYYENPACLIDGPQPEEVQS